MRYDFYAYMDRMKYIRRWQLMRSQRDENIMEHSQSVAMLAHALAVIRNKVYGGNVNVEKTVLYAMYHEISEVLTGDLPTPIKYYNRSIQSAYKDLERSAAEKMAGMLPEELKGELAPCILADEDSEEYKLVKAADRLSKKEHRGRSAFAEYPRSGILFHPLYSLVCFNLGRIRGLISNFHTVITKMGYTGKKTNF